MSLSPVAFIAPNYRDYKGWWLKFYSAGTTTPKTIILNSGGTTSSASKLQLNQNGFITSSGGTIVIPYITGAYDAYLFPTAIEADANNTAQAVRVADGMFSDFSQNSLVFDTVSDLIEGGTSAIKFATCTRYYAEGPEVNLRYKWDDLKLKSAHNGITVIDPDVTFYTLGNEPSVNSWYDSSPSGTGVWVLVYDGPLSSDAAGFIASPSYLYNEAFLNRKAIEKMLRIADVNEFSFEPTGSNFIAVWGSIHPLRGDIKIYHRRGCDIKGYYSDPAQLASGQAGHMFGFVPYADPYPGTDYSRSGFYSNITYVLDGEISSIYRAEHTVLHNNNCFGFANVKNCHVIGTGGIGESDHNGVAYDIDCENCTVDLAYIRNTDSQAVKCSADVASTNSYTSVRVGEATGFSHEGNADGGAFLFRHHQKVDLYVGICEQNPLDKRTFVFSEDNQAVNVEFGKLSNASAIVSPIDTREVYINGGLASDILFGVARGGVSADSQSKVSIKNVTVESTGAFIVYQSSNNNSNFDLLEVVNCDFSGVVGNVTPYGNFNTNGTPASFNFAGNVSNALWQYRLQIQNKQYTDKNVAVGSSSFTYDISGANGDFPYTKIRILLSHSTFRYQELIDIPDLLLTGASYQRKFTVDDGSVFTLTTTNTGTNYTFTLSTGGGSGTISSYTLSN